jgi:hypothetical protein
MFLDFKKDFYTKFRLETKKKARKNPKLNFCNVPGLRPGKT